MSWHRTSRLLRSPLARRVAWVVFAIVFYLAGESAVIGLFEPEQIQGFWRWLGIILFPFLLVAFFMLQRFFGCSSGQCTPPAGNGPSSHTKPPHYLPPPG